MREEPTGQHTRARFARRLRVTPERRSAVLEDVAAGSEPRPLYYVLLTVSAGIAAFGLLANSPAIVIGAMLVSPLMTPIFGIALALSRGDFRLLRKALIAEFGGVALIVAFTALLGTLPFALEVTSEMLARTRPTLVDLLVATLAGLAGGIALVDERTSPALPGVAIATSLTPPLAVSGLSIAFGAYAGAWGAFLLFFANFLAILAVGALTFQLAGFVTRAELGSGRDQLRRFAAAGIGLVAVAVLLTRQLVSMIDEFRTNATLVASFEAELAHDPGTNLARLIHRPNSQGGLDVLVEVQSPRAFSPQDVEAQQKRMSEAIGRPVALFVRCNVTEDVAAVGSGDLLPRVDLDGRFVDADPSPDARLRRSAEQLLRELVEPSGRFELIGTDLVHLPSGPVVVASIEGSAALGPSPVRLAEERLRERIGRDDVQLLVRTVSTTDLTSKGRVLLGAAHFDPETPALAERVAAIEAEARRLLAAMPDTVVVALDAAPDASGWAVRSQIAAARPPRPRDVARLEAALAKIGGAPVTVSIWWTSDLVVTRDGLASLESAADALMARRSAPHR